jgi:hypothetical protein
MKNIVVIVLIVACAGLGFFAGMKYQQSQRESFAPGQFRSGSARPSGIPSRSGLQEGRPFSGEIVSVEDKTMTVKTQDGSSKIVIYSDSTKVNKTSEGSQSDLQVGEQAMIIGTEGSDGTVTAQSISIGDRVFLGPNEQLPR